MEEKRNNRAVEKKLKDSLKNDRARIQVGRISHFGLMEMSRQRMRASVLESTMDVCSLCSGTGHVRSDSAIALHVFRAIEEHVSKHNRYDATSKVKTFAIEKGDIAHGDTSSNAVGYQNSSTENGDTSSDDTDEKNGGGRKRGRGRGRRKNRDEENQSSSEETNEEVTEASTNEDENNDDHPRKKRRRGKRGGRRRNNEEAAELETSDENSEAKASTDTTEQTSPAETEPDNAEEKPKSRSTTRRKAPVSKPAEPVAAVAPVDSTSQEPAQEQEKPKRRTTRRKKAVEAEVAIEDAPSEFMLVLNHNKSS
ncbi:Ribonuclease E [Nymphon striatum]|nr:Ribonuclease E [Nymphon striatum]